MKMKYWLVLAGVTWTSPAIAVDLGTVSVAAQSSAVGNSSRSVTIIDRQTIEKSHAQNVVELFKTVPNVVLRDTSGVGAKAQVDLGGFGETASSNSVVMIDGRRINAPDLSGVDWTQIPVDQIERIEIVHGGASVLYGQGAVGGVINIITRIPESGGNISLEGGSYNTKEGRIKLGADAGEVRVEAYGSGFMSDGYRQNGGFERYDSGLRAEVDMPMDSMLYFSGNHHVDRAGLPGSLTLPEMAVDRTQTKKPVDFSKVTDDYFNMGLQTGIEGVSVDIPVTYRKRDSNASYSGTLYPGMLRTISTRPKIEVENKFGDIATHLIAGADISRTNGIFASIKAKRYSQGYYGLIRFMHSESGIGLTAGYRNERQKDQLVQGASSVVKDNKSVYEVGLSADAGAFHFGLNHSTSVRMPVMDERYKWATSAWNTLLRTQTGKHFSINVRYSHAYGYAEILLSRADLTDEIFYNPTTFANENYTGKTRHDVVMLQSQLNLSEWVRMSANYSYTKALFKEGVFLGKSIPSVPLHKVSVHIDADVRDDLNLGLNASWHAASWSISDPLNVKTKLPSYAVVDLSLNYKWEGMNMFVNLDNVLNRKYSNYSTYGVNYYPAPLLSARAGVGYSF